MRSMVGSARACSLGSNSMACPALRVRHGGKLVSIGSPSAPSIAMAMDAVRPACARSSSSGRGGETIAQDRWDPLSIGVAEPRVTRPRATGRRATCTSLDIQKNGLDSGAFESGVLGALVLPLARARTLPPRSPSRSARCVPVAWASVCSGHHLGVGYFTLQTASVSMPRCTDRLSLGNILPRC